MLSLLRHAKIGTMQRRLAWPLSKGNMHESRNGPISFLLLLQLPFKTNLELQYLNTNLQQSSLLYTRRSAALLSTLYSTVNLTLIQSGNCVS